MSMRVSLRAKPCLCLFGICRAIGYAGDSWAMEVEVEIEVPSTDDAIAATSIATKRALSVQFERDVGEDDLDGGRGSAI